MCCWRDARPTHGRLAADSRASWRGHCRFQITALASRRRGGGGVGDVTPAASGYLAQSHGAFLYGQPGDKHTSPPRRLAAPPPRRPVPCRPLCAAASELHAPAPTAADARSSATNSCPAPRAGRAAWRRPAAASPCGSRASSSRALPSTSTAVFRADRPRSGAGPPSQPSYADLVAETQRLRAALLRPRPPARARPLHSADPFERMLYARLRAHRRPSTVQSLACVVVPSARCSRALLQHAFQWTSWLHCAIDHAEFAAQHHHFLRRCEAGSLETAAETPWLGLYFAHLSVSPALSLMHACPAHLGLFRQLCGQ